MKVREYTKAPLRALQLPCGVRQTMLAEDYPRIAAMLKPLKRTGLLQRSVHFKDETDGEDSGELDRSLPNP